MLSATSKQMRKILWILAAAAIVLLFHPGGAGLQKDSQILSSPCGHPR